MRDVAESGESSGFGFAWPCGGSTGRHRNGYVWLTPWGTSVALHAVLLFVLALMLYVNTRPREEEPVFYGQLRDDLTTINRDDQAGDPFTTLEMDTPPSFAMEPDPDSMRVSAPDADQPFGPSLNLATGLPGRPGRGRMRAKPRRRRAG